MKCTSVKIATLVLGAFWIRGATWRTAPFFQCQMTERSVKEFEQIELRLN